MRGSTFLSAASLACSTFAAPSAPIDAPAAWDAAPQGERVIPRLDKVPAVDGAKRVEKLYGPYIVPAGKMLEKRGSGEAPCTDCYITAMFATLKYDNGSEALTSQGAWLHHTVLTSTGNGLLWAAGNERPTIRLDTQHKFGIDWKGRMGYTLDIMSEAKEPFTASMSITYEYVPKDSELGKQYKAAAMRWLQIRQVQPQPGQTVYKSTPAKSTVNGKLLYTIGHMHDGGTNLKLVVNNQTACNSMQFYDGGAKGLIKSSDWVKPDAPALAAAAAPPGEAPAAPSASQHGHGMRRRSPQDGHAGHGGPASFGGAHIAQPGACTNYGDIKVGDRMVVEAYYDFNKFNMMSHEGKTESLMGNCRVYIGPS